MDEPTMEVGGDSRPATGISNGVPAPSPWTEVEGGGEQVCVRSSYARKGRRPAPRAIWALRAGDEPTMEVGDDPRLAAEFLMLRVPCGQDESRRRGLMRRRSLLV